MKLEKEEQSKPEAGKMKEMIKARANKNGIEYRKNNTEKEKRQKLVFENNKNDKISAIPTKNKKNEDSNY